MNKSQNRQFDPAVLAVLHRTGRVWRGVIARLPGNGRASIAGKKPRIVAHREFSAAEVNRIDGWLDQHEAGRVVCVLHASSVICRTCSLPDAPTDQLGPALRLQAEAHLFGIAPMHRMGMAVLEPAPGETSRSGLILAWPESARPELPPTQRELRFAPDIAALACLLNGHRPTEPVAWADREDGSLAIALAHANGAVFRALREDAGDVDAWKARVGRVLAETGLSVGHTVSFIEPLVALAQQRLGTMKAGEAKLLAPPEVLESAKERLEHAPSDEAWWSCYGIAAGVVLARAGELAPLTELRESMPVQSPSLLTRTAEALSSRRAAVAAAVACALVLMFGSLIVNGARLAVLKLSHPETELQAQIAEVSALRNQLVMYRELDRNSWSMTKILSDIVSNTPEGIQLELIRVMPMRTFNVQGRAIPHGGLSATEVVGLMRQYLNDSGIFHDASLNWDEPDAYGNYRFNLSAKLHRPYWRHTYPDELDFATWTLADRSRGNRPGMPTADKATDLAGGPVTDDEIADVADLLAGALAAEPGDYDDDAVMHAHADEYDEEPYADDDWGAPASPPRARPGFEGLGPATPPSGRPDLGRVDDRADAASSPAHDVPPPMTREQIQAMSDAEVRDTLNRVASARHYARTRRDAELQDRLQQEFDWLMERMRSSDQ